MQHLRLALKNFLKITAKYGIRWCLFNVSEYTPNGCLDFVAYRKLTNIIVNVYSHYDPGQNLLIVNAVVH